MAFKSTSDVTKHWREKQNMSFSEFADALNEKLVNTSVTRGAVHQWEKYHSDLRTDYLLMVMMVYNDWRMDWAIDCLCAKLPEVFERDPNGALTTLKRGTVHA